jgi:putative aldouronate transport system substrate-binding protein
MKKKMVKRLMAASVAGTLAVTMFAGCGGSSDSKDSSAKTEENSEDNADKPDTWIADRTITVQAYVDDIGNTLPKDFNNTETMKKITELTGIKLDVKYTPGDSDAKVLASQLASGTIPDVIVSYLDNSTRPEFPLLYKAAKDGMFADVSEYMKNSEVYSKYYEDDYLPDDTKNNIVFRDDLDGVYLWQMNIDEIDRSLEYDADEEYVGGMYIQKAIADDLGIDTTAINTQEDFYDLLVKIKEGGYTDDNGNAVFHCVGYAFRTILCDDLSFFCFFDINIIDPFRFIFRFKSVIGDANALCIVDIICPFSYHGKFFSVRLCVKVTRKDHRCVGE